MQHISIDLVDRPGELDRVATVLGHHQIDIRALSLGHSHGASKERVVKLIVTNVPKAIAALRGAGLHAAAEDVLIVALPDQPGALHGILTLLAGQRVNIEHIYSFVTRLEGKALAVLVLSDNQAGRVLLASGGYEVLEQPGDGDGLPRHHTLSDYVGGDYSWR